MKSDGASRVVARWRDGGRSRGETFFGATPQEARDKAVDFLMETYRTRRDGRKVPLPLLTVADLLDDYLIRSRDRLTGRTIKTYTERARTMILPHLGTKRAADVTPLIVQRWIDDLGREKFRPATIHSAVAVLQGAYREAVMLGMVASNPVTGVRRPTVRRTPRPVWSQDDARAVLATVAGNPIYHALYAVALATGMRPGELRALRWKAIDLDRGIVHVRATISRESDDGAESIVERTKRGRGRSVAISGPVVQVLRWHKTRQAERRLMASTWEDHGIVFDRGDGHWLYQSAWLRFHRDLCQVAGVPVITHHGIRHVAASLMLEGGIF